MTLGDIIRVRRRRVRSLRESVTQPWWEGYYEGWSDAYKDLTEILKQHGFDMDSVVIK